MSSSLGSSVPAVDCWLGLMSLLTSCDQHPLYAHPIAVSEPEFSGGADEWPLVALAAESSDGWIRQLSYVLSKALCATRISRKLEILPAGGVGDRPAGVPAGQVTLSRERVPRPLPRLSPSRSASRSPPQAIAVAPLSLTIPCITNTTTDHHCPTTTKSFTSKGFCLKDPPLNSGHPCTLSVLRFEEDVGARTRQDDARLLALLRPRGRARP